MENDNLIPIGEAAKNLDVTPMTLRRWDESGKLVSIRKTPKGDRYYRKIDIEVLTSGLFKMAYDWVASNTKIPEEYYCQTSSVFNTRLVRMETEMLNDQSLNNYFSLIVSVAGEIGNNSYDHNIAHWPDIPGIFFGYNLAKKQIVLADRGLGILETLKRVRSELKDHKDALQVAFTEIISGRKPEARGNGLKYVRKVISKGLINLYFQTGDAKLNLDAGSLELRISNTKDNFHGCLALISFI
jgi:hypothetical protein